MKRISIAFIFVIFIFCSLTVSLHADETKEDKSFILLMAARNAAKAGWTNKAIQRYEAYLKEKPEDRDVELELADFLQDSGKYLKAAEHYDSLIKKMRKISEVKDDFTKKLLLSAARNAVKNKNENAAIEYYKQVLLFDKIDSPVINELARVLSSIERHEEAIEMCEKSLQYDPLNMEVLRLKVDLLLRLKRYAEAREVLKNIPIEERNTLKYLHLEADIEAWLGNYDTAIEKYQNLVMEFPENRDILSQYIKLLSWAKKWPLLLDTIQKEGDKIEITDDIRSIMVDAYLSVGEEEKAIDVWKTIHEGSDVWGLSFVKVVDKFISRKKTKEAQRILERILSVKKTIPEVHLVSKLAIIYAFQDMPGKGLEILNQFDASPQSRPVIDITKAEILALTGRYEEALSTLQTLEQGKEIGFRPQIVELECYYALEKDEMLIEKSSMILQKLSDAELIDRAKVLILRVLSHIRLGQYKEAEKEIKLLPEINKEDPGSAILVVLLYDEQRLLKKYEESVQVLGKALSKFSPETEMVRPQLLDDVPLSAWKVANELTSHSNHEITAQLAKAEFKAGNYQQSLNLYKELYEKFEDTTYKLGILECYLNLQENEAANKVFDEIQILKLSEKEITRYLAALVRLKKDKQLLYTALSILPEEISQKITIKSIMIIANIQSGNFDVANGIINKYLSNKQEDITVFQAIIERIGYFDRGKKNKYYEFARDWLHQAIEQFPEDTGLRYQYAKLLATHNDYDLANEQLLIIEKNNPEDIRVIRWLAQVNSWRQKYAESLNWYDQYLKKRSADFKRRREVARVYGWALRVREANKTYKKLCEDYPEDAEIYWEWQAKKNNWLGRKRNAISFYNKLVESHPEDAEMLFDLGQMYSMLNFSSKAEDTYKNLFVYMPEHNRASFARESEQWRRKQSLGFKQLYNHQEGTGDAFGNYEITTFRTDMSYSPVRLSETMDLSIGLGNTVFKFKKHGGSVAEHLPLNLNKSFENGITAYMDGEFSSYSENRHETAQFESGVSYRVFDIFSLSILEGREDVLQNFNTLDNSRSRYYTGVRFAWDVSQRIDVFSQVKKHWYDDGNNGTEDYTAIGYKLYLYPRILKIIMDTYGYDVHSRRAEYWSPDNYRKYMAGLIWRHYLGKEHYSGAPKLYYELGIKQGVDNDSIDFTEPKFEFGWDNQRRWNAGFELKSMRSAVYDEEFANVFLNIRF
ncbi:MAG TPA: tetratricopeptide repeat protein [Candidatus Wunengus sp. YC60]|uniref:tetratricopeptide repeat protein n=1 Tax=Candidatus Wunengus sp. YC60 TaxID=3367697 RepID=UPI00402677AE